MNPAAIEKPATLGKKDQNTAFVEYLFLRHRQAYPEPGATSPEQGAARQALAVLRRGLADPFHDLSVFQALRAAPRDDVEKWELDAHLLTACLFALYVQGRSVAELPRTSSLTSRRQSLGASARLLYDRLPVGQESLEKRFAALLDSRPEDLPVRLRHLMQLLRAHDVPVYFTRLLHDLRRWERDARTVRREWAQDYWRPAAPSDAE